LHDLGQRIWLDNITRPLLTSGTLARYIAQLSVTGLTSSARPQRGVVVFAAGHLFPGPLWSEDAGFNVVEEAPPDAVGLSSPVGVIVRSNDCANCSKTM
jgi:hypothetical protein